MFQPGRDARYWKMMRPWRFSCPCNLVAMPLLLVLVASDYWYLFTTRLQIEATRVKRRHL